MTQNRLAMQSPSGHEGTEGGINQFPRGQIISFSENNLNSSAILNQEKVIGQPNQFGMPLKQFENMPHQYNDNYFSEYGVSMSNQCVTPPGQYGNMLNQYGNQSSTSNFSQHPSSMMLHQMAAGGLVQSSNELVSHASPPNHPIPPSQSTNPSLHCISPSGKQNSYLHSSQTVSPQSSAHRTQRVS